jgi:hypothetical protein
VKEVHTQVLGSGKSIVLVEQGSDVGVVVPVRQLARVSSARISLLLSSRSDDSDTTSSDISESNVETSEIGSDNEEHAEWLLGVFDLWQEGWVQSERKGDLCKKSVEL